MNQLIIGMGEVGRGLYAVLQEAHTLDLNAAPPLEQYDVLHICFPYSKTFVRTVKAYAKRFKPDLIVIHSTVALGTTAKILKAVHSPVRGKHPHLAEGIRTFVKYFGGPKAKEAAALFPDVWGHCFLDSRITEAIKLWDTTQYGWMIALEKEMHEWCAQHFLDATGAMDAIYGHANATYNAGYARLWMDHVRRPILEHAPGTIGGHCVMPNLDLLGGNVARTIKRLSKEWK